MAKFKFSLQSVLDYRSGLEEKAKSEYGEAITQRERLLEQLLNLESKLSYALSNMAEECVGKIDPQVLLHYPAYVDALKSSIIQKQEEIREQDLIVEEKKAIMLKAMTDRKAVESLKEKALAEFKMEQKKIEQKFVDQLVSYKFATKDGEQDLESR